MACNSFTSVSLEPPLVLFCAAKSSSTWPRIQAAGKWAANILDEDGEEICRLFAQKGADRFAHIAYTTGPHRCADARRRARVRRLRDRRRARRRRSRHRRRAGARARLRTPRASRCSSTAAATAASRCRARASKARVDARLGALSARRNRSPRWIRVVAAMIAITASASARTQPTSADAEQEGEARDERGSRPPARPARGRSGTATVRLGGGRARRRQPRRDPALEDAGGARSPAGPPSAPTARSSASAGDEPRDPEDECREERDADGALRDPVGPGVDPFDRLIHRRHPNPTRLPRDLCATCDSRDHLRTCGPTTPDRASRNAYRFATLRVQGLALGE